MGVTETRDHASVSPRYFFLFFFATRSVFTPLAPHDTPFPLSHTPFPSRK
jgi:hypothetical protein